MSGRISILVRGAFRGFGHLCFLALLLAMAVPAAGGITLDAAVDRDGESWTTGGNSAWWGQSGTTFDGVDAAQSGPIVCEQQSWIQTTIDLPEGTSPWWLVSFRLKDAREFGSFEFSVDGSTTGYYGWSEAQWKLLYLSVRAGSRTFRWKISGMSCPQPPLPPSFPTAGTIYLDQVTMVAQPVGSITGSVTVPGGQPYTAGGTVRVVDGSTGQLYGEGQIGTDGTYLMAGIRAGNCKVEFRPSDPAYLWQWYDAELNGQFADLVAVVADTTTPGIDAELVANPPPVLDPVGNRTVAEGETLSFTILAVDPLVCSTTAGVTMCVGGVEQYQATGLPPGAALNGSTGEFTWTPDHDQAGSYPVTFIATDGGLTDSETITITVTDVPVRNDLGGDGRADILWRHTGGAFYLWQMDGLTALSVGYIPPIDPSWVVVARGDFNGDGRTDLLWRHTSGQLYTWMMQGATAIGLGSPGTVDLSWSVVGAADFGGDGKADILWRHVGGALCLWQMDGISAMSVTNLPVIDNSWRIQGLADFDGDGRADILWRHTAGMLYGWLMNGAAAVGVGSPGDVDPSWVIVETADVTGDGKADILWRDASGATVIWEMDGLTRGAKAFPGTVDPSWSIADASDFNGDGRADILWRHADGTAYLWLMDGWTKIGEGSLGTIDPSWRIENR